jgi:hypothetical protein
MAQRTRERLMQDSLTEVGDAIGLNAVSHMWGIGFMVILMVLVFFNV